MALTDKEEIQAQRQVIFNLKRDLGHYEQECRLLNIDLVESRKEANELGTKVMSYYDELYRLRSHSVEQSQAANAVEKVIFSAIDDLDNVRAMLTHQETRDGIEQATNKLLDLVTAKPVGPSD